MGPGCPRKGCINHSDLQVSGQERKQSFLGMWTRDKSDRTSKGKAGHPQHPGFSQHILLFLFPWLVLCRKCLHILASFLCFTGGKILGLCKTRSLSMHACVLSHSSQVQLFATSWIVARQAPLPLGFPRKEYWSGSPFPPPGDLPDPGTEPHLLRLLLWQLDSLPLSHLESPLCPWGRCNWIEETRNAQERIGRFYMYNMKYCYG